MGVGARKVRPGRREEIVDYYEQCEVDYRLLWDLSAGMSMHYGLWQPGVRRLRHAIEAENRTVLRAAGVRPGERVLDAGCGVGGPAIYAARQAKCTVLGITLVPAQTHAARVNAKRAGVADLVRFAVMDYHQTGLKGSTFDAIWAIESVCYSPDGAAFAKEAFRLLRPGGRLVVADGFATKEEFPSEERALMDRWLRGWALRSLQTKPRFEAHLNGAGFAGVRSDDVTELVLPSAWRLYLHSLYGLPAARIAEGLGGRSATQTRNAVAARAQWKAWRDGLASYEIVTAMRPG